MEHVVYNLSLKIVSVDITIECILYQIHISMVYSVLFAVVLHFINRQINLIALEPINTSLQNLAISHSGLPSLRKGHYMVVLMAEGAVAAP